MWYIIKDLSVFDELDKIQHDIKTSTFYSAKRWNAISTKSYDKICLRVWRKVEAHKVEKIEWFTIDLFVTDHDTNVKIHKEFFSFSPNEARNNAIDYLSNPDNLYDVRRDETVLSNNPEINEDRNETLEWKLQDSSS